MASMNKATLQARQVVGRYFGVQWYLRLRTSKNSLLFKFRFSDCTGRVVNQLDAPLIVFNSFARSCSLFILPCSCCRMAVFRSSLALTILFLVCLSSSLSNAAVLSWHLIFLTSWWVADWEFSYSKSAISAKIGIARPPFFTGKDNKSRSSCSSGVQMWPSVIAVMNFVSTTLSSCNRCCLILVIALM